MFFADSIGILGVLSKAMQVENPTYGNIKAQIDAAIVALESMKTEGGPFMKLLDDVFPASTPEIGHTVYGSHEVKDNARDRAKFQSSVDLFLDEVITRLQSTYPDWDIMGAFECLGGDCDDPTKQFERLVATYGKDVTVNGQLILGLVNPTDAMNEWILVKGLVSKYKNMEDFYVKFLAPNREVYPNISSLARIGLTIPVTSVNCERGFSRYNAIKTDTRNRLDVSSVEVLMTLTIEAPPYRDFDYEETFQRWSEKKNRRAFDAMAKMSERDADKHVTDRPVDTPLDLTTH